MKRSASLAAIALAPLAMLTACAKSVSSIPATSGSPLRPTAFGSQLYPSDDIGQSIGLLAACGTTLLRTTVYVDATPYFDALFAAAAAAGIRILLISPYAPQPVDVATYAANAAAFQQRYASYNPMWEIWNEPNLAHYWGAQPNRDDYAKLAIATATALRGAGARDILSGGTSGVDVEWIYGMRTRGVYDVVNLCAVHSYIDPNAALNQYLQALSLLPPGIGLYTTEACVSTGQATYLREMWYLHRYLNLPALIWCEFRDGTAGAHPPYNDPMGLVTGGYAPKDVYYTAKSLVTGA